ncbi:unnamed protein product, partial [Timema podura]|nr:unnamed protein product [Timema podura]
MNIGLYVRLADKNFNIWYITDKRWLVSSTLFLEESANKMSLKLYYDILSQPSRAVMLFLLGNKIPFERKEINLKYGDHQSEEFGRLNPFRKVPVIVDGNFPLTESVAILRYLCREKNVTDHWYPRDSKLQAKVDEYLEWQHLDTRLNCSTYFLNK